MTEKYYWDVDVANATKMGMYLTENEMRFIDSFLDQHTIKNCLDIGCGSGRFSVPLHKKGINMTALDCNTLPLNILKEKAPDIKTLCLDASNGLPFENSSFDCIIAIELVDYLPDLTSFFKECNRVLKSGGFLLFTSANKNSYKNLLHKIFSRYRTFYRFSFTDVKSSIEKSGFLVEKVCGFHWIPCDRVSSSKLIPFFESIEKKMKLQNLPSISPWVFFIAKKEK